MPRCRSCRSGGAAVATVLAGLIWSACASTPSAPVVPPVPPAPPPSIDTKVAWILRLEQARILRDDTAPGASVADPAAAPAAQAAGATPAAASASAGSGAALPAPVFDHARSADLGALLRDVDDLVRARAAMAIGRVGLREGAPLLQHALRDPDADVRANAAFALGLLASRESASVVQDVLADPSPAVRVRAVQALGLIADPASAQAIAGAAAGCGVAMAAIPADDEEWPKAPEIEICRQALFALVRIGNYDALAHVALDAQGQPVSTWWPVAYALQRIGDARAAAPLRVLSGVAGRYTAGFALRGLTALKDPGVLTLARRLVADRAADVQLRVAGVRALGQLGAAQDVPALAAVLTEDTSAAAPTPLAIEAISALGTLAVAESFDALIDVITHPSAAVRAAALGAAARVDPDGFMLVLSGLGRDADWTVRAALAGVLGTLPGERGVPALVDLLQDEDPRVHGAALRGLAAAQAPDLADRLKASLGADDFIERATAAELIGEQKLAGGVALLAAAYTRAESDTAADARVAALEGLAAFGGSDAVAVLRRALADREWPVRLRAAELLRRIGEPDAAPLRPAPLRWDPAFFESDALLHPSYSPRAFIETRRGVIEIQLDVVDAPLTVWAFVEQVRSGYFNGLRVHRLVPAFVAQTGDPRGDGTGGPGYTQRDELNATAYLRGTVGMALAGADTGGSQWFITLGPQPHLDGKYTAFGRVVGGLDVLDRISAGDVIERARIWDGVDLR